MKKPLPYTDWYTYPVEKICKLCNMVVTELDARKICNECRENKKKERHKNAKLRATNKIYKPPSGIKLEILTLMGAKCSNCGYNQYMSALQFHHVNSLEKQYNISALVNNYTYKPAQEKYDLLISEVKKCILLCSNCHMAKHAGEW